MSTSPITKTNSVSDKSAPINNLPASWVLQGISALIPTLWGTTAGPIFHYSGAVSIDRLILEVSFLYGIHTEPGSASGTSIRSMVFSH